MATLTAPKKDREEPEPMAMGQKRPQLERYRLQVDRLTKSSFKAIGDAEKIGVEIKKKFPNVHVSIYDAEEHSTKVL